MYTKRLKEKLPPTRLLVTRVRKNVWEIRLQESGQKDRKGTVLKVGDEGPKAWVSQLRKAGWADPGYHSSFRTAALRVARKLSYYSISCETRTSENRKVAFLHHYSQNYVAVRMDTGIDLYGPLNEEISEKPPSHHRACVLRLLIREAEKALTQE